MTSACASGSTSIASARSGTPRRRRWSRTGWSTSSAAPAPRTFSASPCGKLDKLVEVYQLSEQLTNLPEPGSSITWAREIKNINKALLTPTVLDTIVRKVNENEITNSKEIRKLRLVLRDPVAKQKFISGDSLDTAVGALLPESGRKKGGLAGDIEELTQALKRHSWTALVESRGDAELLRQVEEAEKLLKQLKKALH